MKEEKKCSDPGTPESADATTKAKTIQVKYNRNSNSTWLLHILPTRGLSNIDASSTSGAFGEKLGVFSFSASATFIPAIAVFHQWTKTEHTTALLRSVGIRQKQYHELNILRAGVYTSDFG